MTSLTDYFTGLPDWWDDAPCKGLNPDFFFPARGDNEAVAAAKAVCEECPFTGACLDWSLDHNMRDGVYGGYSARERKRLRRTLRPYGRRRRAG